MLHTTLAALVRDIRRGVYGERDVAALVETARMAGTHRDREGRYVGALAVAAALRMRPDLLASDVRRETRLGRDARAVLAMVGRQLGAAWSGDDRAAAWLHGLLPPRPTRRRTDVGTRGRRGQPCPIEDAEMIASYNAMMRYVRAVHAKARRVLTRALSPPAERQERAAQLRDLAPQLARLDPALGDVARLDAMLRRPAATANQLTVEALAPRAKGYALGKLLEGALTDARKAAAARPRRGFLGGRLARVIAPPPSM
jgi:hypothetical protein